MNRMALVAATCWIVVGVLTSIGCGTSDIDGEDSGGNWPVSGLSDASDATSDTAESDARNAGDTAVPDGAWTPDTDAGVSPYWLDLKVRTDPDGYSVETFSGNVRLDGRTVPFRCPEASGQSPRITCGYSRVDRDGADAKVDSSVRIPVGPSDRSPPESVEVEIQSSRGYYSGTVNLVSYTRDGSSVDRCGDTCRGSVGTARVVSQGESPDYSAIATKGGCTKDNREYLDFRAGPRRNEGAGCSVQRGPRLDVRLYDDYPGRGSRTSTYPFGPDTQGAEGKLCRNGLCETVSGYVSFQFYAAGEIAEGYWRVQTSDGETVESSFVGSGTCLGFVRCE